MKSHIWALFNLLHSGLHVIAKKPCDLRRSAQETWNTYISAFENVDKGVDMMIAILLDSELSRAANNGTGKMNGTFENVI